MGGTGVRGMGSGGLGSGLHDCKMKWIMANPKGLELSLFKDWRDAGNSV